MLGLRSSLWGYGTRVQVTTDTSEVLKEFQARVLELASGCGSLGHSKVHKRNDANHPLWLSFKGIPGFIPTFPTEQQQASTAFCERAAQPNLKRSGNRMRKAATASNQQASNMGVTIGNCSKCKPGKWKQRLKFAVPWWFSFDPYPHEVFLKKCVLPGETMRLAKDLPHCCFLFLHVWPRLLRPQT